MCLRSYYIVLFERTSSTLCLERQKNVTLVKFLEQVQAWVLSERWWRHCDSFVWAVWPGWPPSSQAACWWPPPTQLSGGFSYPSWSKCRWSRWKWRSSETLDALCSLCPACLGPAESPTPPKHRDHPELCVMVLTGYRHLQRKKRERRYWQTITIWLWCHQKFYLVSFVVCARV